jgi:hypothetical protein
MNVDNMDEVLYGRVTEINRVAEELGHQMVIVYAIPAFSPPDTRPSYFIVVHRGILLPEPRNIGPNFETAYAHLVNMRADDLFVEHVNRRPYYGG